MVTFSPPTHPDHVLTLCAGYGSYLSVCSKSAIEWVFQKTRNQRFAVTAQKVVQDLCRRLKLDTFDLQKSGLAPEPDLETAWTVVAAYFDETVEGLHTLVHRPHFETRLKAHFSQPPLPSSEQEDPAWYALRNVIYAFGWRHLSQHASAGGFRYRDGEGWKYFLNVLSVHSQLLYCRAGQMAVEALVAMVRAFHTRIAVPCDLLSPPLYRVCMWTVSAPPRWSICCA